jgi:hypothetical protein
MAAVHVTLLCAEDSTQEARIYDEFDSVTMWDDSILPAGNLEVGQLIAGPSGPGGFDGREVLAIHFPEV